MLNAEESWMQSLLRFIDIVVFRRDVCKPPGDHLRGIQGFRVHGAGEMLGQSP
jgi:hypothetical protein